MTWITPSTRASGDIVNRKAWVAEIVGNQKELYQRRARGVSVGSTARIYSQVMQMNGNYNLGPANFEDNRLIQWYGTYKHYQTDQMHIHNIGPGDYGFSSTSSTGQHKPALVDSFTVPAGLSGIWGITLHVTTVTVFGSTSTWYYTYAINSTKGRTTLTYDSTSYIMDLPMPTIGTHGRTGHRVIKLTSGDTIRFYGYARGSTFTAGFLHPLSAQFSYYGSTA